MKLDKNQIFNLTAIVSKLVRYNLKIIFGNIFIYFLLGATGFYLFTAALTFFDTSANPTSATVFYLLLFPGILIIFYPATFGIQNDSDSRTLEILFGIPDYRYKVWLVRMAIIYILVFCILVVLALIALAAFTRFSLLTMVFQLMFPIFFIGSLAFMISTLVRNGYAAMVFLIIIGMIFWIFGSALTESQWNLFLNPFHVPERISEAIWANIQVKNRLYILSATILMLLYGLLNMQKREKFV